MKRVLLTLMVAAFLLLSCTKDDNPSDLNFVGKPLNKELPGTWVRTFSTKDMHNSITIWTDSINFGETNSGYRRIYQFSELNAYAPFQYYTEKDTLFMLMEQEIEKWLFSIRNDSLTMSTSLPLYSSYYDTMTYSKCENLFEY